MKKLIIFFLLNFYQLSLQAFDGTPEEVFMKNDLVKNAISEAKQEGCIIGEPSKVFLHGNCGVVGSFETFLVGVSVSTQGVNPQSWSIRAEITLHNGNPMPSSLKAFVAKRR